MVAALTTTACSPAMHGRHSYSPAVPADKDDAYFQRSEAVKYRALRPHLRPQTTEAECSVASTSMIINASLAARRKALVTFEQVVASDPTGSWAAATYKDEAPGVDLDHLGLLVMQAFYSVGIKRVAVDVMHVEDEKSETVGVLTHNLDLMERFPENYYILTNFSHDRFLGGMDPIGHVSVVGAYDAARERVLVLDVDSTEPMPYWVSLPRFVQGMNTPDDQTGIARGYLVVRVP